MIRSRRWIPPLLFLAAILVPAASGWAAAASPYGYLIADGPRSAVWWAEGAYKVMKSDPVPAVPAGRSTSIAPATNTSPSSSSCGPKSGWTTSASASPI